MNEKALWIYDLPELLSCTALPPTDPPSHSATHIISLETDGTLRTISSPMLNDLSTSATFFIGSALYGIVVYHEDGRKPSVSILTHLKEEKLFTPCIGLRRTMCKYGGQYGYALSYATPTLASTTDHTPSLLHTASQRRSLEKSRPLMDEGTGRIIQWGSYDKIHILDFALYCRLPH